MTPNIRARTSGVRWKPVFGTRFQSSPNPVLIRGRGRFSDRSQTTERLEVMESIQQVGGLEPVGRQSQSGPKSRCPEARRHG